MTETAAPLPQSAAIWASHFGRAAAAMPTHPWQPHARPAVPSPVSRVALAAARLHLRARAREDAERTLRAHELLVGD